MLGAWRSALILRKERKRVRNPMVPKPAPVSDESGPGSRLDLLFITDESATQTTRDKVMRAENLYKGSFLEVSRFLDELRSRGEVKLLILSSSKGLIWGEDVLTTYNAAPASRIPPQIAAEALNRAIRRARDEGAVVIIALS